MFGRILGVEILLGKKMPRGGAKDLKISRWPGRHAKVCGSFALHEARHGAIHRRVCRERLAGGVNRSRGEVQGKQKATKTTRRHEGEPSAKASDGGVHGAGESGGSKRSRQAL